MRFVLKIFTIDFTIKGKYFLIDFISINNKSLFYYYNDVVMIEFQFLFFIYKRVCK